jgi:hypothetical protein
MNQFPPSTRWPAWSSPRCSRCAVGRSRRRIYRTSRSFFTPWQTFTQFQGTVSRDRFVKILTKMYRTRPGRGWFLNFRSSDDFTMQKVYLLRLMPVCVGLIMVSCLLLSFMLIASGVYLFIDKSRLSCSLYCTKNSWLCICYFPPGVGVKFAQSASQWEERADNWRNLSNLVDHVFWIRCLNVNKLSNPFTTTCF